MLNWEYKDGYTEYNQNGIIAFVRGNDTQGFRVTIQKDGILVFTHSKDHPSFYNRTGALAFTEGFILGIKSKIN